MYRNYLNKELAGGAHIAISSAPLGLGVVTSAIIGPTPIVTYPFDMAILPRGPNEVDSIIPIGNPLPPLEINTKDGEKLVVPGTFPFGPIGPGPMLSNPLGVRTITNPDDDPELQDRVVKYYYKLLKDYYLPNKFISLLDFIVVDNNGGRIIKKSESIQETTDKNVKQKIDYIFENVFGKYNVQNALNKVIYKHGYQWHTLLTHHPSSIKKALYKELQHVLRKKLKHNT
jgi:hypothetical protein